MTFPLDSYMINIYFTEIFRYWVEVYKYFVLVSIYTYAVTFWTISNQTSLLKWWKRFRAIWRYVNQTNWSSVTQTQTHIYQLGFGNGLEHVRHQAITGNNVDLLSTGLQTSVKFVSKYKNSLSRKSPKISAAKNTSFSSGFSNIKRYRKLVVLP